MCKQLGKSSQERQADVGRLYLVCLQADSWRQDGGGEEEEWKTKDKCLDRLQSMSNNPESSTPYRSFAGVGGIAHKRIKESIEHWNQMYWTKVWQAVCWHSRWAATNDKDQEVGWVENNTETKWVKMVTEPANLRVTGQPLGEFLPVSRGIDPSWWWGTFPACDTVSITQASFSPCDFNKWQILGKKNKKAAAVVGECCLKAGLWQE